MDIGYFTSEVENCRLLWKRHFNFYEFMHENEREENSFIFKHVRPKFTSLARTKSKFEIGNKLEAFGVWCLVKAQQGLIALYLLLTATRSYWIRTLWLELLLYCSTLSYTSVIPGEGGSKKIYGPQFAVCCVVLLQALRNLIYAQLFFNFPQKCVNKKFNLNCE